MHPISVNIDLQLAVRILHHPPLMVVCHPTINGGMSYHHCV